MWWEGSPPRNREGKEGVASHQKTWRGVVLRGKKGREGKGGSSAVGREGPGIKNGGGKEKGN